MGPLYLEKGTWRVQEHKRWVQYRPGRNWDRHPKHFFRHRLHSGLEPSSLRLERLGPLFFGSFPFFCPFFLPLVSFYFSKKISSPLAFPALAAFSFALTFAFIFTFAFLRGGSGRFIMFLKFAVIAKVVLDVVIFAFAMS
jgi:hypothetical protein